MLQNPGLFAVGSEGEAAAPPGTGICVWFLGPWYKHVTIDRSTDSKIDRCLAQLQLQLQLQL